MPAFVGFFLGLLNVSDFIELAAAEEYQPLWISQNHPGCHSVAVWPGYGPPSRDQFQDQRLQLRANVIPLPFFELCAV